MIRWESVIIATFGTLLGLGVGVLLAWSLIEAASASGAFSAFAVPASRLVVVLGVGAVAGVIASLRPARRAARLDVLQAIGSA
jgi:putative ABC transport system permease protein